MTDNHVNNDYSKKRTEKKTALIETKNQGITDLEIQFDKLIKETDEESVGSHSAGKNVVSLGPVTSYKTLFSSSPNDNNNNNNLFVAPSKPTFSFDALSEGKESENMENSPSIPSAEPTNPNKLNLFAPPNNSTPQFSFAALPSSSSSEGEKGKENIIHPEIADAITGREDNHQSNPMFSFALSATKDSPLERSSSDETPAIDNSASAKQDNFSPEKSNEFHEDYNVVTIRRALDDGIEEEEEIVFETYPPDGDNDSNDDDDREKLVHFTGLPKNPPELTVESMSKEEENPVALSDSDKLLDDGVQVTEHGKEGEIHDDDEEQDEDEDEDEEDVVVEEEEDSDDDSSVETPPIPIEVDSNINQEHSEYDEELEFDASEDSSEGELSSDDGADYEIEPEDFQIGENEQIIIGGIPSTEESVPSASQTQMLTSTATEDDAPRSVSQGMERNEVADKQLEAAIPVNTTLDPENPGDNDRIPDQKPFDDKGSESSKTQDKKWLFIVIFLLFCSLSVAIAVPLALKNSQNDQLTKEEIPIVNFPTVSPTWSPSWSDTPISAPSRPSDPPPDLPSEPTMELTSTPSRAPEPPGNDTCDSALGPLEPDGGPIQGTIDMATVDEVDRCGDVFSSGPGVWYYVLGTGGEMMAHTCLNTDFDSKITIFKGNCDKPLCLEANDDQCGEGGASSAVSWQSEYQQIYRILVHGEGNFDSGNFELALLSRYNDECDTAIGPLVVHQENDVPAVIGNTLRATANDISCNGQGNDSPSVFYLVRGTGGTMTASVCNSADFGVTISVLTGLCPDGLVCLDRTDQNECIISWESTAFQDYYLMIHGVTQDDTGNFELQVSTTAIPSNDSCENALGPLQLDGTLVEGTTSGADIDSNAPFCLSAVTSPGVWFYVTGNGSTLQASLCDGAAFDTRLSIYEGSCTNGALQNLVCVDGNDDFCGTESLVTWLSDVGTNYYILVHGYQSGAGDFKLSVTSI